MFSDFGLRLQTANPQQEGADQLPAAESGVTQVKVGAAHRYQAARLIQKHQVKIQD
jgi:hypothetical protein